MTNDDCTARAEPNIDPTLNAGGKAPHEVRAMFARVARRYDFLNHFLSLGCDLYWRRVAAREARGLGASDALADLCTGTGDLAFALKRAAPKAKLAALDFTPEMVAFGPVKAARKNVRGITFAIADALAIPIKNNAVALSSVAFGIRNVGRLEDALKEMSRIVRPGGKVVILEFTQPQGRVFGSLYLWYFKHVLPRLGRVIATTAGDAYRYLPQSVQAFAGPQEMTEAMQRAGLQNVRARALTFGVVHLYVGEKKLN